MGKTIELTTMSKIQGKIAFNVASGGLENIQYYPIYLELFSNAKNGAASARVTESLLLGAASSDPYTPQEIYDFLKTNVHQKFATAVKDMYKAGIDLELSS